MSEPKAFKKDPFEVELGRASRERMEASGFWGALWRSPELPPEVIAAQEGDARTLARLLHDDPALVSLRVREQTQDTLLHLAARGGHAAAVRLLALSGADPFALNGQALDPLGVLLTSTASEQALRETAGVLLDAVTRTAPDMPRNGPSAIFDGELASEDEATRQHSEENLERLRGIDAAMRLRASGQDCPSLCALLLRTSEVAQDTAACRAALTLARAAGHDGTARVFLQWLRRLGEKDLAPPDAWPMQETYCLCHNCFGWWVATPAACPNCGAANDAEGVRPRQTAWWPWGKSDAELPCVKAQEEAIQAALWDLDARSLRIADSCPNLGRLAGANGASVRGARLAEAAAHVRHLQLDYAHALWSAEVATCWNLLELAVADWDALSFDECGRRVQWCDALRGRWRGTLSAWERRHAADCLAFGIRGEPDAIVQMRQLIYACGQIQQGLLDARAALAVRRDGQSGEGTRVPACPIEPYRVCVRAMRDLARRRQALDRRLALLGDREDTGVDGQQAGQSRHNFE